MAGRRIHWLVPSLMMGSFLLGVVFAIVHHFFYQSLDAQIVKSQDQQEWNLRIGTGLAFLVKAFLTAAAGIAYTQLLWHTLRLRPVSVDGIDALFGVVNNAWGFSNWELWRRGPALALIALIVWTIPLVAIVTPSTLTIRPAFRANETVLHVPVPVIEYDIPKKFAQWTNQGDRGMGYVAPSSRITRLVSAVAAQGSILKIDAPYPNCSYSAEFIAPTLSCSEPVAGNMTSNKTFEDQVAQRIWEHSCPGNMCKGSMAGFVGWVPVPNPKQDGTVEEDALRGLNETLYADEVPDLSTIDTSKNHDHASIYVALSDGPRRTANTVVECGIYNASYKVDFSFHNNEQKVQVRDIKRLEGVSYSIANKVCDDKACSVAGVAYTSLMHALGNILVGYLEYSPYGVMYSSVTQIKTSVFTQTKELQYLADDTDRSDQTDPAPPEPLVIANMTMDNALEEFFTNVTLSFFGDDYFLQNATTAPEGDVTVRTPQNAYQYRPRNLFIAYGVGILAAAMVIATGFACMWTSAQSFSSSFSAILRTTRNRELDDLVAAEKTARVEPMPKATARAKLLLRPTAGARVAFAVVGKEERQTVPQRPERQASHDSFLVELQPKR